MESSIVGKLKSVAYQAEWLESDPHEIPYFDNKQLKILFVEANHEPYLQGADKVLQHFMNLNSRDRIADSHKIYQYYQQTLNSGYTVPLDIDSMTDIWNFVYPSEIIIHWDEDGYYLGISCECEWEEEHGLQLVFKDGKKLTRASGHDGAFTDE